MEHVDIDQLIQSISWKRDPIEQEKATLSLMSIPDLDLRKLIDLPPNYKEYMDNAARILASFPFVRLENVIMDLYRWLMDLNWPGAMRILELLNSFSKIDTFEYFEKAVVEAIETHDDLWLDNLSYFTMYGKYSRDDFQNKEHFDLLCLHEVNMWR